jgi:hypothetical protein
METVRFTVELPEDIVRALDDHCEEQGKKTAKTLGASVRIGRSKGLEGILRKLFGLKKED